MADYATKIKISEDFLQTFKISCKSEERLKIYGYLKKIQDGRLRKKWFFKKIQNEFGENIKKIQDGGQIQDSRLQKNKKWFFEI